MLVFLKKYWYPISAVIALLYSSFYYTWIWSPGHLEDPTPVTMGGLVYLFCTIWGGIGLIIGFCLIASKSNDSEDFVGNTVYKKKDLIDDKRRTERSDKTEDKR